MSKINLTHGKTEYCLEFNRQSVKVMEANEFKINELQDKPGTMIPMLFEGAFIKNHSGKNGVKRKVMDEIFDSISDKSALLEALMEMYVETMSVLSDSTESEGNVSWAMVK